MSAAANLAQASSLVAILINRAVAEPDRTAYHFIGDETESAIKLSYRQLLQEAASLAVSLQIMDLPGKPVLLACKTNFFFVIAFYACLLAGALPVPTAPPRRQALEERISFLASHSGAAAVLTDSDAMLGMEMDLPMMDVRHGRPEAAWQLPEWPDDAADVDGPALILYTSGTTGKPNGVMHSQRSLLAASMAAGRALDHGDPRSAILLTLPLFHDIGLMLGVIHPLHAGVPVYLMTPAQFVQRPERWLALIRHLRITTVGGPNFMFDMVTRDLDPGRLEATDLASLRACFCTGEPVRASTIARLLERLQPFGLDPRAVLPCYSLGEAGRPVTGSVAGCSPVQLNTGLPGLVHPLVSCGKPHVDCRLLIVNPETRRMMPSGKVGEIWLRCDSVALGYWNEPVLSKAVFGARLDDGDDAYLRTGDLALMRDGELYVLGRVCDTVVLGGISHAPHELDLQAERSHAGLRPSGSAAFTVGGSRTQLVIVAELKREMLRCQDKWPHVESAIRSAIRRVHGLSVDAVVLIEPGTLPKTSSGKVRRGQCREDYLAGRLALAKALPPAVERWNELARANKH
nr:AMP-binding protein [uncultured Noviherbaspirillum sp.]